jgi:N-acetylmuramoyl-L-alanine amidase
VRYIFTAAICTLCAITALLLLPPIGAPKAQLVAQSAGDRLAVAQRSSSTSNAPRQLVAPSPAATGVPGQDTNVLGAVELALAEPDESTTTSIIARGSGQVLSIDAGPAAGSETTSAAPSTAPSTTAAPTTTTTTSTTSTTTTVAVSTTVVATTVLSGDGGVIISPRGVVLPVIGPGTDGGWRATTPCGNEVTMRDGERVTSVDFVLDPGHGGSETGAAGPNDTIEKGLNLRVAEIVEWYLEEAGYTVLLTRTTDIRIPLRSRAEIANALAPDAFVSIHHNGGATRKQSTPGTELFVDAGNPESSRLGGLIFEELTGRLSAYDADWVGTWRNGVSARLNSEGADLYGIHRYTPGIVSVITEAGYLSNPSEAALFADNEVQWSHGRAIADGLMRWKRTSDSGSGFLEDFVDDSSSGTGGFDGCTDPSL